MVAAASQASSVMSDKIVTYNTNPVLYEAVLHALKVPEELSEEELAVANQLRIEFEHQGGHLDLSKREALHEIQAYSHHMMIAYRESISGMSLSGSNRVLDCDQKILQKLPPHIQKRIQRRASRILITASDQVVLDYILRHFPDENIRKAIYLLNNSYTEFLPTLEDLLRARHTLATLLDFPCYSEYYGWHRSLKTPKEIFSFLDELRELVLSKSNQELSSLQNLKSAVGPGVIEEWDLEYYKQKYLEKNGLAHPRSLEEYFTVPNVLHGFADIWQDLFNVRVQPAKNFQQEVWHPSVFKLDVFKEDDQFVGSVYCDLFERPHKSGPANFPIRIKSAGTTPTVGLVTNWPRRRPNEPPLLPFEHVHVFFHELGHLLQALLCENKLQHFSGTRGLMDHVETPSQLFQHFATDHRVLRKFAFHFKTGKPVPESLLRDALAFKSCFSGLETMSQICYSALDQALHSTLIRSNGGSTDILKEVKKKYSLIPHADGTYMQSTFSHLLGYGSTYYSYLYSGVHSSQIWKTLFEQNPLSRDAGTTYQKKLLAYGGAKDPNQILLSLTGKTADPTYFIQDLFQGTY
ncbi:uncharacterized protein LOC126315211 [Schistocerca gregaria]|uniref:uncharacterized protein LOC126315211 n=1 Tax=Schistocerca gregaria TaxID=7010 RepID=UPI00211F2747|nr:uncharacterized protein LOC126315211 [Schistocerca gregaria]